MKRTAKVIIPFIAVCLSASGQHQEHLPAIARSGGHIAGRLLVQMHRDANPDAVAQTLAVNGSSVHKTIPQLRTHVIRVPEAVMDRVAASLERTGLFTIVEQDHVAQGAALPNDPSFASEWHLSKIKVSSAWDLTKGSSGIKVAVIDSGVDPTHPDLAAKLVPGWNFVNDNSDTRDSQGHGTAVAGAIAAATNNYTGVAGVAWSNPIMPLVVLDSNNYASYSDVASAITYAADRGARIINISVGGSSASSTMQSAVDYAWNKGAVVFASASNNSSSTPYYPAACRNVVAVSATTQSDTLASFSNYGSWITVSAPGDNILTTTKGGGYGSWYGTSLATPIAAGVGALVFSRNPALSSAQLVTILKQNSDDLGSGGFDQYFGWGRVNAYRAVAAAGGSTTTPPPGTPPPSSGSFTAIRVNAGGGAYTDPQGRQWSADYGYNGGGTYRTGSSISNTNTPALYQSERWNSGTFQYQFAVPNGTYVVNLKFAEIYFQQRSQRVFNVLVNGQTVLPNFDIVAQAGGPKISLDRQFTVSVTGGQIVIQLIGVIQNPKINAIEILAAGTQSVGPIIRVNAGGSSYTDAQGNYWSSDFGYLSGSAFSTSNAISGTASPALYQSERWGSGTLQYQFSVQNGTRYVTLKFAEIYFSMVGQRVFKVLINGQTVLSNFDIVASAGGSRVAFDRQFPVNVTNGQIVIQLVSVVQNPKISAIEIK